jgi:hypothetical protein
MLTTFCLRPCCLVPSFPILWACPLGKLKRFHCPPTRLGIPFTIPSDPAGTRITISSHLHNCGAQLKHCLSSLLCFHPYLQPRTSAKRTSQGLDLVIRPLGPPHQHPPRLKLPLPITVAKLGLARPLRRPMTQSTSWM